MKLRSAFYAGVNGALAMTVLCGLLPDRLLPQNLGLILGSMILREVSLLAWALGLSVHLCLGGLLGMGYACIFGRVLGRSSWRIGLCLAAAQAVLVGPLLALMPAVHPLIPEVLPAPGPFLMNFGALGVASFFSSHLLFGLIVGGICSDLPSVASARRTGELPG